MSAAALIQDHVPLGPRTTLGVGGPARHFVEVETEPALVEALGWASARGLETLVLGAGSNLLVADRGFDGLVVRLRLRGLAAARAGDGLELEAGAGEPWDELVAHAVDSGWAGVECLSGIPGDVGATPIQNVGAYGQEVADTIVRVRVIERSTGRAHELDRASCGFGYRDSVFKREAKGRFVVVSVRFALVPGGPPAIRYAELSRALAARGTEPTLAAVRALVIELRRGKSMVLDPSDENGRSAGSFFMNPVIPAADLAAVLAKVEAAGVLRPGEQMPQFAALDGHLKLSAAWLIERAGFVKGTTSGRVGISTKHSLAIVNKGGATAADIVAFARRVKAGVADRFGMEIHPEPVMVGFAAGELRGLV